MIPQPEFVEGGQAVFGDGPCHPVVMDAQRWQGQAFGSEELQKRVVVHGLLVQFDR